MRLLTGAKFGRYEIVEPISRGCTVYRARDTSSDREVALKFLPDTLTGNSERLSRFEREASALASLNHPNIAAVYGFEESAHGRAVAMELVNGSTLQSPAPVAEALRIGVQIADALEAAHQNGVLHRCLKPSNIMVTRAGVVKVLNFALGPEGRFAAEDGDSPTLTVGTTGYVSPEELRGEPVDQRSDIWSLGAILAEMLSAAEGRENATLPSAIREVLDRALAYDPASRFGNAGEIAALLKRPLEREHGSTPTMRSFLSLEANVHDLSAADDSSRYLDVGLLGEGGMGVVRRVRDRALNRVIAMKIMKYDAERQKTRFLREARITAQLQHPAIVPVHEIGTLADGRVYFTMKEIQGQTLAAAIREAHSFWQAPEDDRAAEAKWTLRRLIGLLQRAAEGVGYAHEHGVLHRDLKPSNIMIGPFGEVLVLDWGLMRLGKAASYDDQPAEGGAIADWPESTEDRTRDGAVMGTAYFMAPEQASGDIEHITVRSDVFSLGCVLYNILAGSPPYRDPELSPIRALLTSHPKELGQRAGGEHAPLIPDELREVCRRAMSFNPEDRYANGNEFAQAVAAWLDGAQRREQAFRVLGQARELRPQSQAIIAEANQRESQAAGILAMVPPFAPVEAKRDAWVMQDRAAELRAQAEALEAQFTSTIHAALSLSDDLAPAHDMLAEYYKERHALAEAARDENGVVRYETLLRIHDRGRFAAYLKGDGALTLVTDPPGARATLYRYEPVERRLQPQLFSELGTTPIHAHSLPMGSYLVRLSCPGRADVDYPVYVERELHWDGIRPGDSAPYPIYLPKAGELRKADRYVPAGWFHSGGDARARNGLGARRLWLDGFVTPRDPVTVGDYLIYLNDLLDNGCEEDATAALPAVPVWEAKEETSEREFGYSRASSGRFVFDGGEEKFALPVVWISWYQANAYSEWLAGLEKMPWRLMREMEHEKASRGADGRYFPWGNRFDATFCGMRESHPGGGRAIRFKIDEFPTDESPYGVRGASGNVLSWCEDAYNPIGPDVRNGIPYPPDPARLRGPGGGGVHRIIRGGSYRYDESSCRTWSRDCPPAICHYDQVGFRVARAL